MPWPERPVPNGFHGRPPTPLGVIAGLLAPPIFGLLVLLQDVWRVDFASTRRFISELAIGPWGWLQIANFLVSGPLVVLFARTLAAHFHDDKAGRWGAYMLAVIGTSMFFSGVFVADASGAPPDEATWHGAVHLLFGLTVFTLIPASCLLFLRCFRRSERWRVMRNWTVVTALIAGGFWIILIPTPFIPALAAVFEPVYERVGVANRVVVGVWLLWLFLTASRAKRVVT